MKSFTITGLDAIKSLTIGENSFTDPNGEGDTSEKSVTVSGCPQLTSINIGVKSFTYYTKFVIAYTKFVIALSSLESLQIGSIEEDSYNFMKVSSLSIAGD